MRRTVLAALAVIGFASVILVAPARVHDSAATWADSEFSQGSLTATLIQPPVMQTCSLSPGLLGTNPVVTVTWRFPTGSSYVTPGNVAYYVAEGGLLSNLLHVLLGSGSLSTTGPVGGTYTTKYEGDILDGLVGGSYGVSGLSI